LALHGGIRAIACLAITTNHWLIWFGEEKHGRIDLQVR
jgi:hypothetical protein